MYSTQIESCNSRRIKSLICLSSRLIRAARSYLENEGFIDITLHMPYITRAGGSCEDPNTLFLVRNSLLKDWRAYLPQTEQLYLETVLSYFKKVYCFGPSFRAEPREDKRHLIEFKLLEIEFVGNFDELLSYIENTVYEMIKTTIEIDRENELSNEFKFERLRTIKKPFRRITYDKVIEMLGLSWGSDLTREQEKSIVKLNDNKPLFITHFPMHLKYFNMKTNSENTKIVNSADLILPNSGESAGAAERESEYSKIYRKLSNSQMIKQLNKRGINISDFKFYLEAIKKNGGIPHVGCGIGVNRVIQFILGVDDIKSTCVFPISKKSLI